MSDKELIEKLLDNEREWRRSLYSKVEDIDKTLNQLRVTVALISGGISITTSLIVTLITKLIGK